MGQIILWIATMVYIIGGFVYLYDASKYYQTTFTNFKTFTTFLYYLFIGSIFVLIGIILLSFALGVL